MAKLHADMFGAKGAVNMRQATLFKWILHVMYMLCARAEIFSHKERAELAQLTADLEAELNKTRGE